MSASASSLSSLSSASPSPSVSSADVSIHCTNCNITLTDSSSRTSHYKSDWHRFNVKRRVLGLSAVPEGLFRQQINAIQNKKEEEERGKKKSDCQMCGKEFSSPSALQSHLSSKKHLKKLAAKGGAVAGDAEDDEEDDAEGGEAKAKEKETPQSPPQPPTNNSTDTPTAVDGVVPPPSSSSSPSDFSDWNENAAIPLLTCLFCREKFENKETLLPHMLKIHGFFIPFIENMIDLDGFLLYLGEKIGIGRVCIWCNQRGRSRYPSVSAVQQHMKEKSHCKIRLETEEEEEEFMEFYQFDEEGAEDGEEEKEGGAETEKSSDGTIVPVVNSSTAVMATSSGSAEKGKRRLAGMNDAGELMMSDGSVIGHRQYNTQYRQRIRVNQTSQGEDGEGDAEGTEGGEDKRVSHLSHSYRQLVISNQFGVAGAANTTRESGKFREAWWASSKKNHLLKIGMAKNTQKHFRAQVMF